MEFALALVTLWIVPVKLPRGVMGAPEGGVGNCEIVTPFVAARFTVRSDWMTVFKWMSSLKARGEFAAKVTGKGDVVNVRVRGVVVGVSWHTVLFAQLPIAAPEPL